VQQKHFVNKKNRQTFFLLEYFFLDSKKTKTRNSFSLHSQSRVCYLSREFSNKDAPLLANQTLTLQTYLYEMNFH